MLPVDDVPAAPTPFTVLPGTVVAGQAIQNVEPPVDVHDTFLPVGVFAADGVIATFPLRIVCRGILPAYKSPVTFVMPTDVKLILPP